MLHTWSTWSGVLLGVPRVLVRWLHFWHSICSHVECCEALQLIIRQPHANGGSSLKRKLLAVSPQFDSFSNHRALSREDHTTDSQNRVQVSKGRLMVGKKEVKKTCQDVQ